MTARFPAPAARIHPRLRRAGHQRLHRPVLGGLTSTDPDLDSFVADARAWLGGVAEPRTRRLGRGLRLGRRLRELDGRAGARGDRPDPRLRAGQVRRRLGADDLAGRVRRPRPAAVVRPRVPAGRGGVRRAAAHRDVPGDPAAGRPGHRAVGHRGAAGERYVRAMLRTDLIACQLFSETEAGSDLAAVRTRAVATATAGCSTGTRSGPPAPAVADWGWRCAAPTRRAAKHAGLTVFLVPMDAPGVTVRPIRQMTGGASFNEVYLDGVACRRRPPARPGGAGLAGRADGAGGRATGLRATWGWPTPTRPSSSPVNLGRPLTELERDKVADLVTRSYVQRADRHAGRRGRGRRRRPRPGGLGRQAARHRHHGADVRGGADAARSRPDRPTRAVGDVRVDRARARRTRATGSPAAPTRSSATSSPSGCSACRGSRADDRRYDDRARRPGRRAPARSRSPPAMPTALEPLLGGHSGLTYKIAARRRAVRRQGGAAGPATDRPPRHAAPGRIMRRSPARRPGAARSSASTRASRPGSRWSASPVNPSSRCSTIPPVEPASGRGPDAPCRRGPAAAARRTAVDALPVDGEPLSPAARAGAVETHPGRRPARARRPAPNCCSSCWPPRPRRAADPVLVHGDYRLGNIISRRHRAGRADRLGDLEPGRSAGRTRLVPGLRRRRATSPGSGARCRTCPTADELVDALHRRTARRCRDLTWFNALGRLKMAAIMGHNLRRHREGRHHDPDQERLPATIARLIRTGTERLA